MNAALGTAGVILGFLAALVGAGLVAYDLVRGRKNAGRKAVRYVVLMGIAVVVSTIAMERALLTHDFSLYFVAMNSSRDTPMLFTIAGMWSALEGSILLWALVLVAYIGTMVFHFRKRLDDAVIGWAIVVSLLVAVFFFGLMLGPANPFTTVAGPIPLDGQGPNPLLQNNALMAFHPPILYAGYVGFTIPFAFGVAALITGRLGEGWLIETRRWTLVAWGFLTTGILLGSWWSYEVLGWGGYWAWDPVENASLLPWLTATAYLHSVMVQERRGMLRIWNLSLLVATFSLTILGTFLTRSGVLDSVHAFSDSGIGPLLLGFFALIVVVTCGLIYWRGNQLSSPGSIASPLSREAAFLANNVVFAALAFVVLLGTVFPLLAEALDGERISVGRPFFDVMVRPLGMTLLFLMAMSPALPWRGASVELLRDRLRWPFAAAALVTVVAVAFGLRGIWVTVGVLLASFVVATSARQLVIAVRRQGARGILGRTSGGMVAHVGLAIFAFGLIASQAFSTRAEVSLREGESTTVAGHSIELVGLRDASYPNRESTFADLKIDNDQIYSPALSSYKNSADAIGTPSVQTTFTRDVYLTLVRTPATAGDPVALSVIVLPMVSWLWGGGAVMALGTVLAFFASRKESIDLSEPTDAKEIAKL